MDELTSGGGADAPTPADWAFGLFEDQPDAPSPFEHDQLAESSPAEAVWVRASEDARASGAVVGPDEPPDSWREGLPPRWLTAVGGGVLGLAVVIVGVVSGGLVRALIWASMIVVAGSVVGLYRAQSGRVDGRRRAQAVLALGLSVVGLAVGGLVAREPVSPAPQVAVPAATSPTSTPSTPTTSATPAPSSSTSATSSAAKRITPVPVSTPPAVTPTRTGAPRDTTPQVAAPTTVRPPRRPVRPPPLVPRTTVPDSASRGFGVRPGSLCSPRGSFGLTAKGKVMVCRPTATDSQNRWRSA